MSLHSDKPLNTIAEYYFPVDATFVPGNDLVYMVDKVYYLLYKTLFSRLCCVLSVYFQWWNNDVVYALNSIILHYTNLQISARNTKAFIALSFLMLRTSHPFTHAPPDGVITGSPTAKQSPRCPLTPDIINGAPFDGTQLKMHQHPPIPLVDAGGGARGPHAPARDSRRLLED